MFHASRRTDNQMMYTFNVTCPRCGGEPVHVTASAETPPLTVRTATIIRCTRCDVDWLIVCELLRARPEAERPTRDGRPACGTEAAYKAHLRRGEPTDPACREAHRVYVSERTPTGARHARPKVPA